MKKKSSMQMKKAVMKLKKGPTKPTVPSAGKALPKKMKMVKGPDGKMVPAFAVDGKGANDLKKSGAKMKKAPMKVTAAQKKKLNPGLLAAIKKSEGSAAKMKKAAMKLKKESSMKLKKSMAMMKKSMATLKKATAMKMKMKKSAAKMGHKSPAKMGHKKK
jgi:hypothetical protein